MSGYWKQQFNDQPKVAKGIEIGLVVVIGVVIVYAGYKAIKRKLDQGKVNKSLKEFKDDISDLEKKGIVPSFTDAQFLAYSNSIQKQFAGCDWKPPILSPGIQLRVPILGAWSESGATLYSIIEEFKNNADFAKLVTAYGIRTYDQCGVWPFSGDFTGDLYQAVKDELGDEEIATINKQLAYIGITYKF